MKLTPLLALVFALPAPADVLVDWDGVTTLADGTPTDDVTNYRVYRDGAVLGETGTRTDYTDTTAGFGTFCYQVTAIRAPTGTELESAPSETVCITLADERLPAAPGGLSVTLEITVSGP